jgi:hypothetical protein
MRLKYGRRQPGASNSPRSCVGQARCAISGGATRTGGTPTQVTHDEWSVLHPTVSPDGRLIAATRIRNRKAILRLRLAG